MTSAPACTAHTDEWVALRQRLTSADWPQLGAALDADGYARLPHLLTVEQCRGLRARYAEAEGFRSRVIMARHGYGRGEYRYFAYPLPTPVAVLREAFYPYLAPIANRWHQTMGLGARFPATHAEFLAGCAAAGQCRPTPLLLQYREGDYNCLHQDLYGEQVFPLQVLVLLSQPGSEFSGGEFVLTEQRPRQQSRPEVVMLQQGDALIFAVNQRPVRGSKAFHRVRLRHGVSRVRSGERHAMGIIFHDAA